MKNFKVNTCVLDIMGKNIDISMIIGGIVFSCKWTKNSFNWNIDGTEYRQMIEANEAYASKILTTIKKMSVEELTEEEKEIAEDIARYIRTYSDSEKVVSAMKKRLIYDCQNVYKAMTEPEKKEEPKAEEVKEEPKTTVIEISENPNHYIKRIKKTMTIKHNKNK